MRDLLTRHAKNFENALSEVQRDYLSSGSAAAKARIEKLQVAIASMFDKLNATFENHTHFEFNNDRRYSVSEFLAGFDAIFGLKLELIYAQQVLTASNTRWNGLEMVGMTPVPDPTVTGIGDQHKRQWRPLSPPFAVSDRFQPYFKIHGSSNWYTADGRELLVMGGDKEFMIREHEVLRCSSLPSPPAPVGRSRRPPSRRRSSSVPQ